MLAGLAAGGGGGGSSDASGTLRLALTDAPSCGYDTVNLTIQKVRVHQSSSAVVTGVPVTAETVTSLIALQALSREARLEQFLQACACVRAGHQHQSGTGFDDVVVRRIENPLAAFMRGHQDVVS